MPTTPLRDRSNEFDPVLASHPSGADEFDALADLFLSDDEPPVARVVERVSAGSGRPARERAAIEVLVQGHLPVRAAPWASQYARLRAAAMREPVALVRLVGGQLSVEVFGGDPDADLQTEDATASVARAREQAALCIVQVDEVHQVAAAGEPRVSAVTVLGGVNEAAVVATYRTLKGLASALARGSAGDDPPTELQVAFVAAEPEAARDVLERLRRAVSVFLDRPLVLAGVIGKIAPTGAAPIYRGECGMGPGKLLDLLTEATRPADDRPRSQAAAPPGPAPSAAAEYTVLTQFIPGLRAFALRCPDDPSLEMGVDGDGRLHLLRANTDQRGVERLLSASAWAMKHSALLRAAGCGADFSVAPALHLFTSEPKAARHLLEGDVRVRVLARVGAEWYCAELN